MRVAHDREFQEGGWSRDPASFCGAESSFVAAELRVKLRRASVTLWHLEGVEAQTTIQPRPPGLKPASIPS